MAHKLSGQCGISQRVARNSPVPEFFGPAISRRLPNHPDSAEDFSLSVKRFTTVRSCNLLRIVPYDMHNQPTAMILRSYWWMSIYISFGTGFAWDLRNLRTEVPVVSHPRIRKAVLSCCTIPNSFCRFPKQFVRRRELFHDRSARYPGGGS